MKAMTNIVERLRSRSPYLHGSSAEQTMEEAAAEIERLKADLALVERERDAAMHWVNQQCSLIGDLNAERVGLRAEVERLTEALKEIEWSNNSKWQADRARRARETKP